MKHIFIFVAFATLLAGVLKVTNTPLEVQGIHLIKQNAVLLCGESVTINADESDSDEEMIESFYQALYLRSSKC